MRLQQNLRQRLDGTWDILFRGDELKVEQRNGQENVLPFDFPADLQDLLEEWLTLWRPRLAPPSETHVFLNQAGRPFSTIRMCEMIKSITWRFSAQVNHGRSVVVSPHMIRDIFATTLIREKEEFVSAAKMLGNTVGVVAKHDAHLLEKDTQRELTPWLQAQLVRPPYPTT
jgi:site-specific recombinase XerD